MVQGASASAFEIAHPEGAADGSSRAAQDPGHESVLDRYGSYCPTCGNEAEALVLERDGGVYQRTLCPSHSGTENLILTDVRFHRKLEEWNRRVFPGGPETELDDNEGKAPLLAVIDLTNRCNYSCPVCFAAVSSEDVYYLDVETVRRMLTALINHKPLPCRHVQFSGGEPTLHPRFLDIVRMSKEMGFNHVQVATNGSMFATPGFARKCEEAGLQTLYLQFDGMDDDVYRRLRGRPLLEQKLEAFRKIEETSMRVVLVPTLVAGVNVGQMGAIFNFALEHSHHVTGISVQPMAATGRVKVPGEGHFNLVDMAREFGAQTGLTRFPDDWFPLNSLTMITRGVARMRGEAVQNPACDAFCSVGAYFYVDENNRATSVTRFFDLERFLQNIGEMTAPQSRGFFSSRISGMAQLMALSSCFDGKNAPEGLSFLRLLKGLDGWEDKSIGRGRSWFKRGFNGMFFAGMHFMDATNYSARRVHRCIIKYVTTDGRLVSFCNYNSGTRQRDAEDAVRLSQCNQGAC
jgi:7,8-dihydro-6-hydroxymethylpterin dimethyltransferase